MVADESLVPRRIIKARTPSVTAIFSLLALPTPLVHRRDSPSFYMDALQMSRLRQAMKIALAVAVQTLSRKDFFKQSELGLHLRGE